MKITVGKYTIYSDKWSVWINEKFETIDKKTKQPTGKYEERKVAGYCNTLERTLEDFIDKKFMGSDAEDLEAVLKALRDAETVCKDIIDAIVREKLNHEQEER